VLIVAPKFEGAAGAAGTAMVAVFESAELEHPFTAYTW